MLIGPFVCMYVCMNVYMYVCMYVFMYVCMYVYMMYVCMYVCMYVEFTFIYISFLSFPDCCVDGISSVQLVNSCTLISQNMISSKQLIVHTL